MGHQEKRLIDKRLLNLKPWQRRFRINAGQGWTGQIIKRTPEILTLKNPRVFKSAPKGWADLCGWDSVEITPDMVGQVVAVFVFEEVKATGDLSKEQKGFKKLIERMGGVFTVLRD